MYNFKGLDKLVIEELQKRVEELEKVLGNFAGLEEEIIKLADEFKENFKELLDKFDDLNDKFDGLKEQLEGVKKIAEEAKKIAEGAKETAENAIEAVGEQEKIMATCIIVSAVAAIAITSFVAFCIYQGVKLEKEKEKNSSKDTPDAKLSNVDATDGTEKLQNNLKIASIAA
ncbi:hypothetical protein OZD66_00610 [Wolbachia endosymbiont of Drosophila baimaii]|nr:hypothetical protein [Wolbachia endosymbiont of Drosophila baimaii]MBA8756777.1 hypothetical protein [Wolbachia pipientis]MDE5058381.1 hypothetical protein [Wolbachia endosymbiont of Drosophila baimaii]